MKRLYALLSAIMMAAVIALPSHGSTFSPKTAAMQDTLILKLKNDARLLVVVKDVKDLKNLKYEKIDSLVLLLEKYADQIEAAGKNGEDVTVKIDRSSGSNSEEVNITVTQNKTNGTEVVIKEKNRIRINDKVGIDVDHDEVNKTTKVKVNVGDDDDKEKEKKEKSRNPKKQFNFIVDLGVSHWANKKELPGATMSVQLRPIASRYISLNSKWQHRIGGEESPMRLLSGFGFDFHNYMFDDNMMIQRNEERVVFTQMTPANLDKSKLATTTFNVPLEVGFDFKNKKGKTNFKLGGGGFVGYLLSSHSEVKYSEGGDNCKNKVKDDFYLTQFQYGVSGFVGIRGLEFFGKYNMNELFKENKGPQANAIAAGLRITI